jgi:hypothetical protein
LEAVEKWLQNSLIYGLVTSYWQPTICQT